MAITASGLFGLTLEKIFRDTAGVDMESESLTKTLLVTDSYTPNFDTHDFVDDANASEVSGTGYSAGGVALTSTELAIASGAISWDAANPSWAASTIAGAMAAIQYLEAGAASADMLVCLLDFVTAASTNNGLFEVQFASGGIFSLDYTP